MALKKIKPLSPDIYLGKTKGDNELARLAHVNDIVSKYRKSYEFEVPANGDTLRIIPNQVETVVYFKQPLTNDFTIDVVIDPRLSVNLAPGDRMYIFLEGNCTVTFTGAIIATQCGGSPVPNEYNVGDPICIEVLYNGNKFVGVDNC